MNPRAVHQRTPLDRVAIAHNPQNFIAGLCIPKVAVSKLSDTYYVFGTESRRVESIKYEPRGLPRKSTTPRRPRRSFVNITATAISSLRMNTKIPMPHSTRNRMPLNSCPRLPSCSAKSGPRRCSSPRATMPPA